MISLRKSVLQSFKKLHRTRKKVFEGDDRALAAARLKINEEYKKNKLVSDVEAIKTMIKFSEEVEHELRTTVIQAKEVEPGLYEAKITKDTVKLENIPYNYKAVPNKGIPGDKPCCQETATNK